MISVKKYDNIPVNTKDILRYMSCPEPDMQTDRLIKDCLFECSGKFKYMLCFDKFPVSVSEYTIRFPFAEADSVSLSRHLSGFSEAVVFAATVGIELDRLIMKYSRLSPSRALCFQAIGAERIEALCDLFCRELKSDFSITSPRFSPGYGDFSLYFQKELFKALDCPRKIGLSLNSALLMSPSKSVTAIIGVKQ